MNVAHHRNPVLFGSQITSQLPEALRRPAVLPLPRSGCATTTARPRASVAYHQAVAMTLRLRAHGASPTVDALLAYANAVWDAAMTSDPVTISLRQSGIDDYEECDAIEIGVHLARTYNGNDGRITRLWCERHLMSFEGLRQPLTDAQWNALQPAIAAELEKMVREEREWAQSQNDEEREMPVVDPIVREAA